MRVEEALREVRVLFLDTAPVIYHVEGNPRYQVLTDEIFQMVQDGAVAAVTTPITLSECLVHPYRARNADLISRFRQVVTAGAHTRYQSIDGVAEEAAELRDGSNLSLTDAIQVAAAIASGCDAFLTNDTTLRRVASPRIVVLDDLE